jgi:hypothetical protein
MYNNGTQMDKEQSIDQFLKALRISFNYISLYSRSHRTFLSSIGQLRAAIDSLTGHLDPVEIGCTVDSLIIDNRPYGKSSFHRELAKIFHARKIKSLRFSSGITEAELADVLYAVSLPVNEIRKSGGLGALLKKYAVPHFHQEELDYSRLLKDEGEETSDVWSYLLGNALDNVDAATIGDFKGKFESMAARITRKELVEDEKLRQNIQRFLEYIKNNDSELYARCSRALLKSVLMDPTQFPEEQISKLRELFTDFDIEELSAVLWDCIENEDAFDNKNLEVFALLVDKERHAKIADFLVKKAGSGSSRTADAMRLKRIKNVFSSVSTGPSYIPEVYRLAITTISGTGQFGRGLLFERDQVQLNYYRILLNLLMLEKEEKHRERVLQKMVHSWDQLISRVDPGYLLALKEALGPLVGKGQGADTIDRKLSAFIEEGVWSTDFPEGLRQLALSLEQSALGADVYLHRIFEEGKFDPLVIELFFKFFPARSEDFYAALTKRSGDLEFMAGLIDSVKRMGSRGAVDALEKIFSRANELVKIEVIQAMAELPGCDSEFLFSLLETGDYFLKKEALVILKKDHAALLRALKIMFEFRNPWGKKNKLLLENLTIVLEADCRQAKHYLERLAKRNFLFYSPVARKARETLEQWNA